MMCDMGAQPLTESRRSDPGRRPPSSCLATDADDVGEVHKNWLGCYLTGTYTRPRDGQGLR
jgi:hypothetical protein